MKFFLCECTYHALAVTNDFCDDIELSIWQQPDSIRIRDKLVHIWYIIKYGHPYADFVVLNREKTEKLRDYLSELLEKNNAV